MIHGGRPGAPITELEMGTLWLKAQGLTYGSIARRLGTTLNSAESAGQRVMRKLGAPNIREAVSLGSTRGVLGPYMDCGSRAAQRRHRDRGEPLCARCGRR